MKYRILKYIVLFAGIFAANRAASASYIEYPLATDTLLAGSEIACRWDENDVFKAHLFYSTDGGAEWNEIAPQTKRSGVSFGVPYFDNQNIMFKSIAIRIKPIEFIREIPNAHSLEIRSVEVSPDGSQFITAGKDGRVVVRDAASCAIVDSAMMGGKTTYYASFMHNRDTVLIAESNSVVLWDRKSGTKTSYGSENMNDIARCVASHPTESIFAAASYDGRAYVFSPDSLNAIRVFRNADTFSVYRVRFSPDGKYLLVASSNGEVNIWDWRRGGLSQKLVGHGENNGQNLLVWSCDVSADGKLALTGGVDRTARLWSMADGKEIMRITKHTGHLRVSRFHPEYPVFMTASLDSTLCQWDLDDGMQIGPTLADSGKILCAEYSIHGDTILSGGRSNSICIWKNFEFVRDTSIWKCRVLYPATISAPVVPQKTSEVSDFEFRFACDGRVPEARKRIQGVKFDALVPAGSLWAESGDVRAVRSGAVFDTLSVESNRDSAGGVVASFRARAIPAVAESGEIRIENFKLIGNDDFRTIPINGYMERNPDKNYDHFVAGPNPADAEMTLKIYADEDGYYRVDLINLIAVRIGTILDEYLTKGYHEFRVDTKFNASGWYMLRLVSPTYSAGKKIMFVH